MNYEGTDFGRYFGDLLGVTKSKNDSAQKVILEFENAHAPYVITKPIHQSQTVLSKSKTGTVFRIDVVLNFELEPEILGFGECVKVLSPRLLVNKIKRRLTKAAVQYEKVSNQQE